MVSCFGPSRRVVSRDWAQPGPDRRHAADRIVDRNPWLLFEHARSVIRDVCPHTQENHAVPRLGDTVALAADDEVGRLKIGPGNRQRPELVSGRRDVLANHLENATPSMCGREHPLHVLHDEHRRSVPMEDVQVLLVEHVPDVVLEVVELRSPCATDEGVELAGRTAYEDPRIFALDR